MRWGEKRYHSLDYELKQMFKEKTGKYRSITKTGREIGKENRKDDSGPRVKLRNGKEISCNSRARVWILNLDMFWRFFQLLQYSLLPSILCCIYQWKTLQNSLDYQFRLLTG